jgi:hypothetical protein
MSELHPDLQLEIAHVLFIDIVGYSKLLIDEQHELLQRLNQIVRRTEAFRSADAAAKLVRFPTGDGMALVFSTTPDAPVQCALEISKALQNVSELQRTGQWYYGRQRSLQHRWIWHQHGAAGDGLR